MSSRRTPPSGAGDRAPSQGLAIASMAGVDLRRDDLARRSTSTLTWSARPRLERCSGRARTAALGALLPLVGSARREPVTDSSRAASGAPEALEAERLRRSARRWKRRARAAGELLRAVWKDHLVEVVTTYCATSFWTARFVEAAGDVGRQGLVTLGAGGMVAVPWHADLRRRLHRLLPRNLSRVMNASPTTGSSCSAPTVHGPTSAGALYLNYRADAWARHGVPTTFVQDNQLRRRGMLRGIHFQTRPATGKLVRARGRVLASRSTCGAARRRSGEWVVVFELDDVHGRQLWDPGRLRGMALNLSEETDFVYKCTNYYEAATESGIVANPRRRDRVAAGGRAPLLGPRPRRPAAGRHRRTKPSFTFGGCTALRTEPDRYAAPRQPAQSRCWRGGSRARPARASWSGYSTL